VGIEQHHAVLEHLYTRVFASQWDPRKIFPKTPPVRAELSLSKDLVPVIYFHV